MALSAVLLFHVGEALNGLGEFFDGGIGVPVLDAVAHAVLDVSFQHHLAHSVQALICASTSSQGMSSSIMRSTACT